MVWLAAPAMQTCPLVLDKPVIDKSGKFNNPWSTWEVRCHVGLLDDDNDFTSVLGARADS